MAGGSFGNFTPPHVHGRWQTKLYMAPIWFFVMYRMYYDGGHHFFRHHSWDRPEIIAHLEEVDKKYGTRYALDNMHHH
ncbi:hypothetical protein HK098_003860 [Nowakowskiella sp. JEL0407]|nr:hypothetical protein HK098_003860 [Nowakowskiella sp. JEL0407]